MAVVEGQPGNRYFAFTSRILLLPEDVIHTILTDLQVSKILQIISLHNLPALDAALVTHPLLKTLCDPNLQEIKEYFKLYLDLLQQYALDEDRHPKISELDADAATLVRDGQDATSVLNIIKERTMVELFNYAPFVQLLQEHSDVRRPIPHPREWKNSSIAQLQQIVESIKVAESAINDVKSKQLQRLADLLENGSGVINVVLDELHDVNNVRLNKEHRKQQLLSFSKAVLRPQLIDGSFVAPSIFTQRRFYLVASQHYVTALFKVLNHFPLGSYEYPSEIYVVLELRQRHGRLLQAFPSSREQPGKTDVQRRAKEQAKLQRRHLKALDAAPPLDEKEFLWIEAFISVCNFMSEMQEKWPENESITVAEFWRNCIVPVV